MDKKFRHNKKIKQVLKNSLMVFMSITIANINTTYGYTIENKNIKTSITLNLSESESLKSSKKIAYITIDDGPSKYTEDIIKILEKYKAKGTFFMIDRNMKVYPEKVKEALSKGNAIGLHSVSHDIHELYRTNFSAKEEFDKNKETFYRITGQKTNLIRLPYGSKPYTSTEVYNNLVNSGYSIWDWDIDTEDWRASSEQIINNVKMYSKNQDEIVILIHEKKQTVEALDKLLKYLHDEGYEFKAIDQEQEPQNFWLGNLYEK
ncbi:MAG: polysaccharide deacetylase family protein [Peptostreptococcaceae bacterium]